MHAEVNELNRKSIVNKCAVFGKFWRLHEVLHYKSSIVMVSIPPELQRDIRQRLSERLGVCLYINFNAHTHRSHTRRTHFVCIIGSRHIIANNKHNSNQSVWLILRFLLLLLVLLLLLFLVVMLDSKSHCYPNLIMTVIQKFQQQMA